MNRRHSLQRSRASALALLPAIALIAFDAQADVGAARTIATGLANPRGLDFAPTGALFVAESGSGGTGNCTPSPPAPAVNRCYGETGAVTWVLPHGGLWRVWTGLPSLVLPNGTSEGGPVDVNFFGMVPAITISWGGDPAKRAGLGPKSHLFGSLVRPTLWHGYQVIADVAAHEVANNPAGGPIDSNPYGTVALPGRWIVADAGANALIEVRWSGQKSTFFVPPGLPQPPDSTIPPFVLREPVPTSIAEGPDGGLYVGQLSGFPFWQGRSSILRVSSHGGTHDTFLDGVTAVVDVAFDRGGGVYWLETASGQTAVWPTVPPSAPNPGLGVGRLLRKCPKGDPEVLLTGLTFPGGVAIGPDGAAYLTNFGTSATAGEVLRLPLKACKRWRHH